MDWNKKNPASLYPAFLYPPLPKSLGLDGHTGEILKTLKASALVVPEYMKRRKVPIFLKMKHVYLHKSVAQKIL